jgi:hypothetical protein
LGSSGRPRAAGSPRGSRPPCGPSWTRSSAALCASRSGLPNRCGCLRTSATAAARTRASGGAWPVTTPCSSARSSRREAIARRCGPRCRRRGRSHCTSTARSWISSPSGWCRAGCSPPPSRTHTVSR